VAKQHTTAADVTEEFESLAERFAGWVSQHPGLAAGIAAAVLAAAGGYGVWTSWRSSRQEGGSDALDAVRVAYLQEMGAPPGSLEVPELANPKAAQEIRERYLARFREVADAQRGTTAGTLALFEIADLLQALGRQDELAAVYAEALANAPGPELAAFVQRRTAYLHEDRGEWAEAAAAHEAAAVPANPLRYWALADAARCRAEAGQTQEALALYDRLAAEAPDLVLPDHLQAQAQELRAAAAGSAASATAPAAAPPAAEAAPIAADAAAEPAPAH